MKRWIVVLSALALLQSGIIFKQAKTIADADAKIAAMETQIAKHQIGQFTVADIDKVKP